MSQNCLKNKYVKNIMKRYFLYPAHVKNIYVSHAA